jgi:hypothetical protein
MAELLTRPRQTALFILEIFQMIGGGVCAPSRRSMASVKISEGPGVLIWRSNPGPPAVTVAGGEPFSRAFMPARPGAVQRPVGGHVGGAGGGSGV